METRLQVGDVLVQAKGFPWPELAWLATGEPFPHAQIVSAVETRWDGTQDIKIIESHATGLWEKDPWHLGWFEVWRPGWTDEQRDATIARLLEHQGTIYAYHKLVGIGIGTRLGLWQEPEDFDAIHHDSDPMYCSEAIARHAWRSGYDLVPGVSNRNTLPADLRNPERLEPVRLLRPLR